MTDLRHDSDAPAGADRVTALGYGPMDAIHAQLDALLLHARAPFQGDWVALLTELEAHLKMHFEAEDRWMRETDFPPRDCHIDEHAAVLRSCQEVLALARQGDSRAAPGFIEALVGWFPGHADYLDSALAAWMCKRQYGGKPVVLHRTRSGASHFDPMRDAS